MPRNDHDRAKGSTMTTTDCPRCTNNPGYHADLHVGHMWMETSCPAYQSLDGSDCTCSTRKG